MKCPACNSTSLEIFDGTEDGDAFICLNCAEELLVKPSGDVERYGKNYQTRDATRRLVEVKR